MILKVPIIPRNKFRYNNFKVSGFHEFVASKHLFRKTRSKADKSVNILSNTKVPMSMIRESYLSSNLSNHIKIFCTKILCRVFPKHWLLYTSILYIQYKYYE